MRSCSTRPTSFCPAATRTAQPVASEDWLRDNHHVVQDQVRDVRQDLPRRYYLELPKLADGQYDGYPRVYVLARELVTHTAGRFDLETLVGYISALSARRRRSTIGETWAMPIMLRLGARRRAAPARRRRGRGAPQP